EHVEKSIGKMVEHFEVMRPGFFTRVFMGRFEPFDGKSVRILEASDADELFSVILEEYTKRLLKQKETTGNLGKNAGYGFRSVRAGRASQRGACS
ncbi:hypothetical protein JTM36_37120, partial [Pseudomonas aeruginosa]|nr:hypothetical protein [Pseudomonas aeruginosa]